MRDNYIAMKASLLVVASFGLVAYGAVQWKHSKRLPKTKHLAHQTEPKLLSQEGFTETVSVSVDRTGISEPLEEVDREQRLEKVIQANMGHVTRDRCIVVFENGTSVIIEEPSLDPTGKAKMVLTQCYSKQIKFKTHSVEEGRTLVSFDSGLIYHWLFPDDAAVVGTWPIEQIKELLVADELKLITENWNPPLHARLGLTARKWLAEDIADLRVVKILRGTIDTGVGQVGAEEYNSN